LRKFRAPYRFVFRKRIRREADLRKVLSTSRHISLRSPVAGAFTLVEICVALGIIAFALMAIIGLLPAAISVEQDSRRETVSSLIGRSIFAALDTNSPLIQKNGDSLPEKLDPRSRSKTITGYDEHGRLAESTDKAVYLADIEVFPNTPQPNLSRVTVTVRTPPKAPAQNQEAYVFATYLNANDPYTAP
jgi:uncharacterized protein (TIGR02598 family)